MDDHENRDLAVAPQPTVLVVTPVKNAAEHLPRYVENLSSLTYPRHLVSIGLLESDSEDGSFELLARSQEVLAREFSRIVLFKHDFGFRHSVPRWDPSIQRARRSIIAKSRNELLMRALRDEAWVLWLDADVVEYPPDIIEQLLRTGKDVVVPHCVQRNGRTFDLNTFQFKEGAASRDWTPFVRDGIVQPPKGEGRFYLEDLRAHAMVPVDSVGGTMLLIRADLHREGLVFPAFSYKLYIETEGLAMMAKDMGYACWGLPNLEIVHA